MSIYTMIAEAFAGQAFTYQDVYAEFPLLNKSSVRSALYRARRRGLTGGGGKGKEWTIAAVTWRLFRHAKRLIDTNKRGKKVHRLADRKTGKNEFDLELTCEGYAPAHLDIKKIERYINPRLVERGLEVVQMQLGVYLRESNAGWTVMGSEWRDSTRTEHAYPWELEAIIVNAYGRRYVARDQFEVAPDTWAEIEGRRK